jgi:adenylate cyclase
MYTDMVGYTALGQRNESLSLALVEEQRKLLRPIFNRHSGREVKTMGDAFLVEFSSALDAVRCAYDIQRATREFNISLPDEKQVRLRVGVHLGDVVESQGDVLGDAVNVASRIQALAEEGGVCITEQVFDHVKNKLDVSLVSKGKMSLKNVSEPVEVYRMVMPWSEEKAVSPTQLDKNRIAVLPFTNMSPDPQDEYFADGMTEELISTISGISQLSVISRTSVMGYKGTGKKMTEIGRELRVGTILEGSVRKADNTVRITAQLIDVDSDKHLWARSYDRELRGVFAIQSDIASKIAEALRVNLSPGQRPAGKQTESIEAYTLYLKGRFHWNKRDKEGVLESLKLFQEAIRIDPDYAKAYAGLADAYAIAANNDFMDAADGLARSKEAAMKALELDDTLAEAHASLGLNLYNELRYEEAQRKLRRAIELNPSYASAHQWVSMCLRDIGRAEEATKEIEKAHELDPLSPIITFNVGAARFYAGRLDEAIALADKLIEDEPNFAATYMGRATCFLRKGMKERAYADLDAWHRIFRDEDGYKINLAVFDLWFGEREKASSMIEELILNVGKPHIWASDIATCYAILGNRDGFFNWIDKAIAKKRVSPMDLRDSPMFDKVRGDPRFPEIFKKLGVPC